MEFKDIRVINGEDSGLFGVELGVRWLDERKDEIIERREWKILVDLGRKRVIGKEKIEEEMLKS